MRAILFVIAVLLAATAAAACAEATDGVDPNDVPWPFAGESSAADPAPDAGRGGGGASRPPPFDAAATASSDVRVEEISGSGEWIELRNGGGAPADLSGWRVADRDKNTGGPKLDDAVTFAAGTTLAPGAFALVVGGGLDPGKPCPGPAAVCVNAEFGISRKNGETIFLLDPRGAIASSVDFPPSEDALPEQSWCRGPGGAFANCSASPGAPN